VAAATNGKEAYVSKDRVAKRPVLIFTGRTSEDASQHIAAIVNR
jgi:hypothetical protein